MSTTKYFHKLSDEEYEILMQSGPTVGDIIRDFKQPDWCNLNEALDPIKGCESLTGEERTDISIRFCKSCSYCRKQLGIFGV